MRKLLVYSSSFQSEISDTKSPTGLSEVILTTANVESQTFLSNGCKNTNRFTCSFSFCINRLTLKSMKGLLKSTSNSLTAEIVIAPIATCAL